MRVEQEFATPEDALAHFGTRGMRWGVRRQEVATSAAAYKQRGAVKTQSLLQAGKPYGSTVAIAAGAVYLNKKGYKVPSTALGLTAVVSANRAYKKQQFR